MSFKPTLAVAYDPAKQAYPVLASPKIDGVRCTILDGVPKSRSLKLIPSKHVQACLSHPLLENFDGELIVGEATAQNAQHNTTSHVMSHGKEFDFTYHVFDFHLQDTGFETRLKRLTSELKVQASTITRLLGPHCRINFVKQVMIHNDDELDVYEAEQLALGYEGVMLRKPDGHYKYGRSTVNEGLLLKVKRFEDSECEILEVIEQQKNNNDKTVNELGRSKRSSHKENKTGKSTTGSLRVRDLKTKVEFNIGTGMNDEMRQEIWDDRDLYIGRIVTYKFFPKGIKDLPLLPVFKGFRSKDDM
jgi:DNA ligase-1